MRKNNVEAVAKFAAVAAILGVTAAVAGCATSSVSGRDAPAYSARANSAPPRATGSVRPPPARLQPPPRDYSHRSSTPPDKWSRSGGNYGYNYDAPTPTPRLPKYATPDRNRSNYQWNGTPPSAYPNYSRTQQPRTAPRPRPDLGPQRLDRSDNTGRSIEVQPGDTLYGLSERHRVSMADVMRLNNLRRPNIQIGQRLLLPPTH